MNSTRSSVSTGDTSLIVSNFIKLDNDELTARQWQKLEKQLTFVNDKGELVECFRRVLTRGYTKLPRGAWSLLPSSVEYYDRRAFPHRDRLQFVLKLDDVEKDQRFRGQSAAVEAMFENEQGLIIRPPGTGKTQIALKFAADVETKVLVITHTKDILDQWVDYTRAAVPDARVGIIQGTKERVGDITIASVQTLRKFISEKPKSWWAQFGCVILDEAHHASAASFEAVLNTCPARYRFGFTASESRADGMHPTMKFIIGPIIHRQAFSSPVDLKVVRVKTKFYFPYRGRFDWSRLLNALVSDEKRNRQIAEVINAEVNGGNSVLVLSRRIEHLQRIAELVDGSSGEILTGKRTRQDRRRIISELRDGTLRIVFSTQLADEALDVQRLNRVLLVHPGKHEGRIIQQIGRAIRKHPEKRNAVIYDFVDWRIRVLRRQWSERRRTYKKNGISIKRSRRKAWR